MKKSLIILTILFISCGSSDEGPEPISIEESQPTEEINTNENENNDEFQTLVWPADYDIFNLYSCLGDKGLGGLPEPQITDTEVQVRFDDGYDDAFFNEFNTLVEECEQESSKDNGDIHADDDGHNHEDKNGSHDDGEQRDSSVYNPDLECNKTFYLYYPESVDEDENTRYYNYYWQDSEKICVNIYQPELIDDEWEKLTIDLFEYVKDQIGIYVPINVTLMDQRNSTAETLNQVNVDHCLLWRLQGDSQRETTGLENCVKNSDQWGNRSAAAGVEHTSVSNGGELHVFVDVYTEQTYDLAVRIFIHEYIHVHQNALLYYFEDQKRFGVPKLWLDNPEQSIYKRPLDKQYKFPNWLEEGGAEFAGNILATKFDNSIDARAIFAEQLDEARNVVRVAASKDDIVSLRDYEYQTGIFESDSNPNNGIAREFAYQYTGGSWAHVYLASLNPENYQKLIIDYYKSYAVAENENPTEGWKVAFEEIFDLSIDTFYRDFDAFMLQDRDSQMSILPSNKELQQIVLTP